MHFAVKFYLWRLRLVHVLKADVKGVAGLNRVPEEEDGFALLTIQKAADYKCKLPEIEVTCPCVDFTVRIRSCHAQAASSNVHH